MSDTHYCPTCGIPLEKHPDDEDEWAIKGFTALRKALTRAERKLTAYVGVCKGDKELTDTVLPMCRKALATVSDTTEKD